MSFLLHSKLSALQPRALVIERDNKRDFFPQLKLIHRSWSWNVGKEPGEPPGVRAPTTGVTVRLFVSQRQPAPEPPIQSHKNPVSASAMLTGKFLQIRKVFATSSLLAEADPDTLQYKISR